MDAYSQILRQYLVGSFPMTNSARR
jgi:hypothetical protein